MAYKVPINVEALFVCEKPNEPETRSFVNEKLKEKEININSKTDRNDLNVRKDEAACGGKDVLQRRQQQRKQQ